MEARTQYDELIRLKPNHVTFQIDLTRIDMNLGFAQETTSERVRYVTTALVARRKLLNIEPRRSYFVNEYVKNCLLLSFALHATEDWKPALDYATEGVLEVRKQLKFGTDAALQLMVFDLLGYAPGVQRDSTLMPKRMRPFETRSGSTNPSSRNGNRATRTSVWIWLSSS